MLYEFFWWLHIISTLIWLCAFVGSVVYGIRIYRNQNKLVETEFIKTDRWLAKWGTVVGASGIIISGWFLSTIPQGPQWGWFDVHLYPWLALKQFLFIVLIIVIAIDNRRTNRLLNLLQSENPLIKKQYGKWKKVYLLSIVIYSIVVLSVLLGWYKPGITTFG